MTILEIPRAQALRAGLLVDLASLASQSDELTRRLRYFAVPMAATPDALIWLERRTSEISLPDALANRLMLAAVLLSCRQEPSPRISLDAAEDDVLVLAAYQEDDGLRTLTIALESELAANIEWTAPMFEVFEITSVADIERLPPFASLFPPGDLHAFEFKSRAQAEAAIVGLSGLRIFEHAGHTRVTVWGAFDKVEAWADAHGARLLGRLHHDCDERGESLTL